MSAEHIVSPKAYLGVFVVLMVLTGLTVYVAYIDLGAFNTLVALLIAVVKALCVILIFMHVRWEGKIVGIFAFSGFLWLAILIGVVWSDVATRGWLPVNYGP